MIAALLLFALGCVVGYIRGWNDRGQAARRRRPAPPNVRHLADYRQSRWSA